MNGPLTAEQQELVVSEVALVERIATRMSHGKQRLDRDDAIGAGFIGLCDAAVRFDPSLGLKFSTLAGHRIRGAILDMIRMEAGRKGQKIQANVVQLRLDSETSAGTLRQDHSQLAIEDHASETNEFWEEAVVGLDQRERIVAIEYYRNDKTMKQIAEMFGVTDSMISLIIKGLKPQVQKNLSRDEKLVRGIL